MQGINVCCLENDALGNYPAIQLELQIFLVQPFAVANRELATSTKADHCPCISSTIQFTKHMSGPSQLCKAQTCVVLKMMHFEIIQPSRAVYIPRATFYYS